MTNALFLSFPSISFCHSERERGIQYGCFTALSMTSAVSFRTLFFVIPSALFLSFRAHARNPVWMLHCAYAPFSMTSAVSFRALFFVIPSAVRNPVHGCFASLSMTSAVSFRALFFVIPSAVRNPVHGCFAPFSMTSVVSFRALFFVIPSESEESSMDASLRSA